MDLLSASGESHRRCLPSDLPSPTPASPEPSTTDDSDDDGLTVRAPLTLDDDGDIPLDIPVSSTSASTTPQEQQHQHQQQQEQHRWRRRRRALLGAGGVLAVLTLVCCIARSTAARRAVTAVLQYIQRDAPPALGALLFVALDVVCIVLMLPGTPLNLAAGLIFGFARGTAVSVTGITLGAVAGFLLGRTVLRRWAERRARENPTVRAALDAVGESAFTMVFLLRLSPVMPFPLLSYVLGATPTLSFTTYTLATFLGLVPSLFTFSSSLFLLSRSCLCVSLFLPFAWGNNSDHGILLRRQVPRQSQRRLGTGPHTEHLCCHSRCPETQHQSHGPRRRHRQHCRHRYLCCSVFVPSSFPLSLSQYLSFITSQPLCFPHQIQNVCLQLCGNVSNKLHQSAPSD